MVEARTELFARHGLTRETHYLASTGIEGSCSHRYDTVLMDAYSILGLAPQQVSYLNDFDRLCATKDYNVTFERGTRKGQPVVDGIPMLIVWAIILVIFGHILLTRTRFGKWIFASGGDAEAARNSGVPVNRVKILMFMFTAFCATVFATCQVMEFGSAGADRGLLKEFEAIIAVVIGGALLTGGYGSVLGAALGALIFGVVQQGLFFAGVESSLFRVFLGVILLAAVILNTYIRRMITGER